MAYTFAFLFISKLNGTVFMGRFFAVRRDHHITNIVAYYVYKEILTKIITSKRSILNHIMIELFVIMSINCFFIYMPQVDKHRSDEGLLLNCNKTIQLLDNL